MSKDQVTFILREKLLPCKFNVRRSAEGPAIEEMANSIREHGIIQPLVVRPLTVHTPSKRKAGMENSMASEMPTHEIICGHRRFMGAEKAGLIELPCIIRELSDEEARKLMLIENIQRENLPPLEEANGFTELLTGSGGMTFDQLCTVTGKSPNYVHGRLSIARMIPQAKEALGEGRISLAHAIVIASAGTIKLQESLLEASRHSSPKHLKERLQRESSALQLKVFPWKLSESFPCDERGACESCPMNTQNSTLAFTEIHEEGGLCTDHECFEKRLHHFYSSLIETAHAEGLLIASESYSLTHLPDAFKPFTSNILVREIWRRSGESEEGALKALILGWSPINDRRDPPFSFGFITVKNKAIEAQGEEAKKQERKNLLAKVKQERDHRGATLTTLLESAKETPEYFMNTLSQKEVLIPLGISLITSGKWHGSAFPKGHPKKDDFLKEIGVPEAILSAYGPERDERLSKWLTSHLSEMEPPIFTQFLARVLFQPFLECGEYRTAYAGHLTAMVEALGVEVPPIENPAREKKGPRKPQEETSPTPTPEEPPATTRRRRAKKEAATE